MEQGYECISHSDSFAISLGQLCSHKNTLFVCLCIIIIIIIIKYSNRIYSGIAEEFIGDYRGSLAIYFGLHV